MDRIKVSWQPYSIRWPAAFKKERGAIQKALQPFVNAATIEHIGSTSVPCMGAKAYIDMAIELDSCTDQQAIRSLKKLGYHPSPNGTLFVKNVPRTLAYRVDGYIVHRLGTFAMTRCTRFRDYLRTHPTEREEYSRLKRDLARKENKRVGGGSALHYTVGKRARMAQIMSAANLMETAEAPDFHGEYFHSSRSNMHGRIPPDSCMSKPDFHPSQLEVYVEDALAIALATGDVAMAKSLMDGSLHSGVLGKWAFREYAEYGITPLGAAILAGNADVVMLLLDYVEQYPLLGEGYCNPIQGLRELEYSANPSPLYAMFVAGRVCLPPGEGKAACLRMLELGYRLHKKDRSDDGFPETDADLLAIIAEFELFRPRREWARVFAASAGITESVTVPQVVPTAALQEFFKTRPGLTRFIGTILLYYFR